LADGTSGKKHSCERPPKKPPRKCGKKQDRGEKSPPEQPKGRGKKTVFGKKKEENVDPLGQTLTPGPDAQGPPKDKALGPN